MVYEIDLSAQDPADRGRGANRGPCVKYHAEVTVLQSQEVAMAILAAGWTILGAMAPYLLLGFFFAGVLSVAISPEWVERHLGGRRLAQVFAASLFGVPLPLCSCGVIPVAASLRRHGAGKGATTAFLLSTPQTGVDSIAVTYALLGPFLAIYRPLAALVTGVIGGALVHLLDPEETVTSDKVAAGHDECSSGADACSTEVNGCCGGGEPRGNPVVRALRYGFLTLPRDIGKALIVGIAISGAIAALVEPNALQALSGPWAYLAAMAVGIPLYVCATASTPIALGLILAGVSPGAALVFLISGPATNGATLSTLWKVLGRRTAMIYLATVGVGSLATGIIVDAVVSSGLVARDLIVRSTIVASAAGHHQHGSSLWPLMEQASALVLIAILIGALWPRRMRSRPATIEDTARNQERLDLVVAGMHCQGCVDSLTRALAECVGVTSVDVDLSTGRATVQGWGLSREEVEAAIASLGFSVS
jgi:uncharacterized membrane protein YraQ (UPF0718 family)/copper chaperone CopZ